MSDQFLGEIRAFPFNFAPYQWAQCDGQLLPISQYTALFSLLGTYYGGDGKSNFALPNLQNCMPLCYGEGTGLTIRDIGEPGGETAVELITSEMPAHTHAVQCVTTANSSTPTNAIFGGGARGKAPAYAPGPETVVLSPTAVATAGNSIPHNNMPPYLVMNYCIALSGVYPARS
jgi:microcystin-dependent protein